MSQLPVAPPFASSFVPPGSFEAPAPAPSMPPPPPGVPVQQAAVDLGLSRVPPGGWGVVTRPQRPIAVRRRSGGKAGAFIGAAVAFVVVVSVIGSVKSSNNANRVTVSIPSFSIAPSSLGGIAAPGGHHPVRPPAPNPARRSARSLNLAGTVPGQRIRVTLTRVVSDARPTDAFMDSPGAGKRLLAAQFRITNTGSQVYVDSPTNGAFAYDSKGHKYRATFLFEALREGRIFDSAVSLQTGGSATGFIAFDVPTNATITKIEFSENSGFGQKGDWPVKA
ncbi:MAG TPA: DUF4352 domain-containing protein [Mycobacteriales bacterium]|nr:DUF4352 domain-containing protein [Mycobacteriales bacterium]